MTDWLNKMLDSDAPAEVPEGFAESVMSELFSAPQIAAQQRRSMSFMKASGFAAAAALMLVVGIWIGQGSRPMSAPIDVQRDAEMAAVMDALLQEPDSRDRVMSDIIIPLERDQSKRKQKMQSKVAATRVDFFTLVRGEGE